MARSRAPSVCTGRPGCFNIAPAGSGKCDECKAADAKRARLRRTPPAAAGYDRRWAQIRGRFLKLHPDCSEPGCRKPATDVHHKDGRGPLEKGANKFANLEGLCHSHHSKRTAQDQPGGFRG